jgi:dipeptidyl aminopeptidase/acylaminoacyl peptidase
MQKALLLFLIAASSFAADGTIVEQQPCGPYPIATYDVYVENAKKAYAGEVEAAKREGQRQTTPLALLTKEQLAQRQKDAERADCRRVKYLSDGLKVVAYVWQPKSAAGKLPLIVFTRGGNQEFGKVLPWQNVWRYALEGFVVIAPQYRGNDGGEGKRSSAAPTCATC